VSAARAGSGNPRGVPRPLVVLLQRPGGMEPPEAQRSGMVRAHVHRRLVACSVADAAA
jgi:hypothetical protein